MKTRRIAVLAGLAVVALVGIYLADAWSGFRSWQVQVAMGLANTFACASSGWLLAGLRRRHPGRAVGLAAGWVLGGLLLLGGWIAWLSIQPRGPEEIPSAIWIAPLANALAIVGSFFLLGDALAAVTRNVRSLRVRIIAFGMLCAGAAVLISFAWSVGSTEVWGLRLIPLAAMAIIVWALARVVSHRLTERLVTAVEALRGVSAGRLDARLDESGRDELAELGRAFNAMIAGLRERAMLERAFGKYVAPAVLEAIRRRGSLRLDAERREVSVFFADIRGFTAMSEANAPEDVVRLLDVYLGRVVEVVARHDGFLNKFIGDAVMVVFNAPLDQPDHARRALACAAELQVEVDRMNAEEAFGPGRRLDVGVGVCTGPAVAGTLGSDERAEFTVIGDTVNTASRLTSAAAPGEVLVSAATARAAPSEGLEPMAPLQVKGKAQALEFFRLSPRPT